MAIKVLRWPPTDTVLPGEVMREVLTLQQLAPRNISWSCWTIALTAMLPEPMAFSFHRDFLDGLAYMHSMSIVHRDLKPGNLLLFLANDCRMRLRIADVGQARVTSDSMTPQSNIVAQGARDHWSTTLCHPNLCLGKWVHPGRDAHWKVRFPGSTEAEMLARIHAVGKANGA